MEVAGISERRIWPVETDQSFFKRVPTRQWEKGAFTLDFRNDLCGHRRPLVFDFTQGNNFVGTLKKEINLKPGGPPTKKGEAESISPSNPIFRARNPACFKQNRSKANPNHTSKLSAVNLSKSRGESVS